MAAKRTSRVSDVDDEAHAAELVADNPMRVTTLQHVVGDVGHHELNIRTFALLVKYDRPPLLDSTSPLRYLLVPRSILLGSNLSTVPH